MRSQGLHTRFEIGFLAKEYSTKTYPPQTGTHNLRKREAHNSENRDTPKRHDPADLANILKVQKHGYWDSVSDVLKREGVIRQGDLRGCE